MLAAAAALRELRGRGSGVDVDSAARVHALLGGDSSHLAAEFLCWVTAVCYATLQVWREELRLALGEARLRGPRCLPTGAALLPTPLPPGLRPMRAGTCCPTWL